MEMCEGSKMARSSGLGSVKSGHSLLRVTTSLATLGWPINTFLSIKKSYNYFDTSFLKIIHRFSQRLSKSLNRNHLGGFRNL